MNDTTNTFNCLRPRLQGMAYRMLGSLADAEEVVQDAWLRWHEADTDQLDNTEAWLVSVTTRLAIDRLRRAKIQREHYIGSWLPEPLLTDSPVSPEQVLERADDISVAFLALLERLAAVFRNQPSLPQLGALRSGCAQWSMGTFTLHRWHPGVSAVA